MKDEKDKFVNKEKRKLRRGARIAGIFAAVGITLGVAATKLPQLPEGKNVKTQEQTLNENRKSKNDHS